MPRQKLEPNHPDVIARRRRRAAVVFILVAGCVGGAQGVPALGWLGDEAAGTPTSERIRPDITSMMDDFIDAPRCPHNAAMPAFTVHHGSFSGMELRDVAGNTRGILQGREWPELVVLDVNEEPIGIYNVPTRTWRDTTAETMMFDVAHYGRGSPMQPTHPEWRNVRGMLQVAAPDAPCPGVSWLGAQQPLELRGPQS